MQLEVARVLLPDSESFMAGNATKERQIFSRLFCLDVLTERLQPRGKGFRHVVFGLLWLHLLQQMETGGYKGMMEPRGVGGGG